MGGLGVSELLLIALVLGALVLVGFGGIAGIGHALRPGRGRGHGDFESRVLDELEVLRVRMDAIVKRLDAARIPDPDRSSCQSLPAVGEDDPGTEGSAGKAGGAEPLR